MDTSTIFIIVGVIAVVLYFVVNIVGTVYYVKLTNLRHSTESERTIGIVTVIFGWFLFPFLNLYSPIVYSTHLSHDHS